MFKLSAKIYKLLLPAERKKAIISLILIAFNAVLDIFSLASIIPFVLLLFDDTLINRNPLLFKVYSQLHFARAEEFIVLLLGILFLIIVVKNLLSFRISQYTSRFVYKIAGRISEYGLKRYFEDSFANFTKKTSSESARQILNIPIEFCSNVFIPFLSFLAEIMVLAFILIALVIYNPTVLGILSIVIFPPIMLFYFFKRKYLHHLGARMRELYPKSTLYLFHGIYAYLEARLYQKEDFFIQRFINTQKKLNGHYADLKASHTLPHRLLEITAVISISVILLYSYFAALNKAEIILFLGVFAMCAYRIIPSLHRMIANFIQIKTYESSLDILLSHQNLHPLPDQSYDQRPLVFNKSLSFEEVCFQYDGTGFKLNNISFTIKKGEKVAFIGRSGSGKTTLIYLILRLLKEHSGQMLLDETVLKDCHLSAWQSLLGYVQQKPLILEATLAENIAFGEKEINTEALTNAITQVGLKSLIDSLPKGLHTMVGENGIRISGGQGKLLAIARAIYQNAEILIFDEATSELDMDSENQIISVINHLAQLGKTIIIVTHHIHNIDYCDRIYQLEKGKLVASKINKAEIQGK